MQELEVVDDAAGGGAQHRLCDLQFEAPGRQPGLPQDLPYRPRQAAVAELVDRDVDAEPRLVRPGGGGAAGLVEHPQAELADQVRLLGDRDEAPGRDRAALGMRPAQQRLAGIHRALRQVDDRLVGDGELARGDRLAQVALEAHLVAALGLEPAGEQAPGGLAGALGGVERAIGLTQHRVRRRRAVGERDADAGGDLTRRLALDVVGAAELDQQTLGQRHRQLAGSARQQQRELVAAEPGGEARLRQRPAQPVGELAQERVAGLMPELVVDRLEAVEVEEEERGAGGQGALGGALAQAAPQHRPVRQAGQGVVMGEPVDLLLGPALARHVLEGDDEGPARDLPPHERDRPVVRGRDHDRLAVAERAPVPGEQGRPLPEPGLGPAEGERPDRLDRGADEVATGGGKHLVEALVEEPHLPVGVEQAQALRHGREGEVEDQGDRLDLVASLPPRRHLADGLGVAGEPRPVVDRRDDGVGAEAAAVAPRPPALGLVAPALAGGGEGGSPLPVRHVAIGEAAPEDLRRRIAGQPLGAGIPGRDPTVRVEEAQGLVGRAPDEAGIGIVEGGGRHRLVGLDRHRRARLAPHRHSLRRAVPGLRCPRHRCDRLGDLVVDVESL